MKIAIAVVLSIVLIFIAAQVFFFFKEERSLAGTLADTENRLRQAQAEEQNLAAEVNYLANPANLEKELRARFNYTKPGETMIVIVQSSTATSGAASSGD
jgi:cell division protein FtsB